MPSYFKLEITIPHSSYVLPRGPAECLLAALDAMPGDLGEPCLRLRDNLREALAVDEAARRANKEHKAAEHDETLDTQAEDAVRPCEDGTVMCFECGYVGDVLPMARGDAEPLYVCRTNGCGRQGRPSALTFFMTGLHDAR